MTLRIYSHVLREHTLGVGDLTAVLKTAAAIPAPAVEYVLKAMTDDPSKATEGKDQAPEPLTLPR
jgi:hypothetical protein